MTSVKVLTGGSKTCPASPSRRLYDVSCHPKTHPKFWEPTMKAPEKREGERWGVGGVGVSWLVELVWFLPEILRSGVFLKMASDLEGNLFDPKDHWTLKGLASF